MALSSPGIGSGLDVAGLVSQLMSLERRPILLLDRKEASFQARISAFGTLKGVLSTLQTTVEALADPARFSGTKTAVADPTVLTASAGATVPPGNLDVAVTRLAKAQTLVTRQAYTLAPTDTFQTGKLTITVGPKVTEVVIGPTSNTLAGIKDAINAANAGVTASVINDGTTSRLVLAAAETGIANAVTSIAVTEDGSVANPTHALADLSFATANAGNFEQPVAASNALLTINNIAVEKPTNTITDAIEGVTLTLLKEGAATRVGVARDFSSTKAAIEAFVKAYNDAAKALGDAAAFNAATKQAGPLQGESTVRSIQGQLRGIATSALAGAGAGVQRLSEIGITLQKDGSLKIDGTKLDAALADPARNVAQLFAGSATVKGIAQQFEERLDVMLGAGGLLASRTDGLAASIRDIGKRREAIEARLVQIEARYQKQFSALDTMIASMTKTSEFLQQQLANLPKISAQGDN